MPVKKAAPPKAVAAQKNPTTHKGHPHPHSQPVSTAGVALPSDPLNDQLQEELAERQQPGKVSRDAAEFIDAAPGYSRDQLDHMSEYYGL